MKDFSFKSFMEWADFGFERSKKKPLLVRNEAPSRPVNIEAVMNEIKFRPLGIKRPTKQFFSEVQWGDGPGAVKMMITPPGGTKAIFRKLGADLQGNPLWITKKVWPIGEKYDYNKEMTLVADLLNMLSEVDQGGYDAPSSDYEDLENLVIRMSSKIRLDMPDWFVFEGIRKLEDDRYIIRFGCRGQGQGRMNAPSGRTSGKLFEFIVDITYHPVEGFIKIMGGDVNSTRTREEWSLGQSQFIEYFTPIQKIDEIINAVTSLVASY
jgi:hypothetical protein